MQLTVEPARWSRRYRRFGPDRANRYAGHLGRTADALLILAIVMVFLLDVFDMWWLRWPLVGVAAVMVFLYRERHSMRSWADGYLDGLDDRRRLAAAEDTGAAPAGCPARHRRQADRSGWIGRQVHAERHTP